MFLFAVSCYFMLARQQVVVSMGLQINPLCYRSQVPLLVPSLLEEVAYFFNMPLDNGTGGKALSCNP